MSQVYLIPSFIADNAINSIPAYIKDHILQCQVIFAENIRTVRRYLKALDSTIQIDAFEWHEIHKSEDEMRSPFKAAVQSNKNIAIVSEAGCPGVADPGQVLVSLAHQLGCIIHPLVGPSSILLALMGSGMNGQQFEFVGYLPIEQQERVKRIKELELHSSKYHSTKIFIETPYRNEVLWNALVNNCRPETLLCLASDLTGAKQRITTKSVALWQKQKPIFEKVPVVFLLYSG
jgi:16S rRNA (cytidine1402-2'-O)-methyltransferase